MHSTEINHFNRITFWLIADFKKAFPTFTGFISVVVQEHGYVKHLSRNEHYPNVAYSIVYLCAFQVVV